MGGCDRSDVVAVGMAGVNVCVAGVMVTVNVWQEDSM